MFVKSICFPTTANTHCTTWKNICHYIQNKSVKPVRLQFFILLCYFSLEKKFAVQVLFMRTTTTTKLTIKCCIVSAPPIRLPQHEFTLFPPIRIFCNAKNLFVVYKQTGYYKEHVFSFAHIFRPAHIFLVCVPYLITIYAIMARIFRKLPSCLLLVSWCFILYTKLAHTHTFAHKLLRRKCWPFYCLLSGSPTTIPS